MTQQELLKESLDIPNNQIRKTGFFSAGWKIAYRYSLLAVFVFALLGETGCKTKKVVVDDSKARMEREAREKELADKKKKEEEERLKMEAEEKAKKEAEEKERARRAPFEKLESYFSKISTAANPEEANRLISEAQGMFSSASTPVLILIYKQGETKDYDKPSDINKYLNFLKDQKKSLNRIDDLQFDSSGKITEVTLIKK
jgi:flagellar biosynthesis GTPase FlhF